MNDIDSVSTKIALITFGCVGALPVLIMPIFVGAMVDYLALTGKEAGLIVSVEMIAIGLAVFGTSLVVHRWNRRTFMLVGLGLIIVGHLASAAAGAFMQLAVARTVAGFGGGILVATMKASLASIREPVRILGIYGMCILAVSAASFSSIPLVIRPWGIAGAYVALGILALPCILLIRLIPRYAVFRQATEPVEFERKIIFSTLATVALFGYYVGVSPVWNYVERLGVNAGLEFDVISKVLSGVAIAGMAGAALAAILNTKYGSTRPLVYGFMLIVGSLLLLVSRTGFGSFTAGAMIFNFGNLFTAPYLLGALAKLDPQGRLIVVGFLMQNIGMATGVALAAMMLTNNYYVVAVWISMIAFGVSFAPFLLVMLWLDRPLVPSRTELTEKQTCFRHI